MKTKSIKILAAVCITCFLFSCKNGDKKVEITVADKVENKIEDKTKLKANKQDGPFGVKSGVVTYESKKLDGTLVSNNTFYFEDFGNILKLEESTDGETSLYMYNQKAGKGLTVFPGRKPNKIRMRQGELNLLVAKHSTSGYAQQANETIAGKDCVLYANNAKSAGGESKHIYWKYNGVLLKEINRLGAGYILEALTFEEKDLENSVFSELNEIK